MGKYVSCFPSDLITVPGYPTEGYVRISSHIGGACVGLPGQFSELAAQPDPIPRGGPWAAWVTGGCPCRVV